MWDHNFVIRMLFPEHSNLNILMLMSQSLLLKRRLKAPQIESCGVLEHWLRILTKKTVQKSGMRKRRGRNAQSSTLGILLSCFVFAQRAPVYRVTALHFKRDRQRDQHMKERLDIYWSERCHLSLRRLRDSCCHVLQSVCEFFQWVKTEAIHFWRAFWCVQNKTIITFFIFKHIQ